MKHIHKPTIIFPELDLTDLANIPEFSPLDIELLKFRKIRPHPTNNDSLFNL